MLGRSPRTLLISAVLCSGVAAVACGPKAGASRAPLPATAPAPASAAAPAPAAASTGEPLAAPPAGPVDSPGFQESMAALRPAAAAAALSALVAAPADAQAYAQASLAYAQTDVPAMALIWGLTYQAMGGGSDDAAVAAALAKVLHERVTAKRDEQTGQVNYNLRLAPGQMPARQAADGSVHAPVAHVFEAMFGTTVMGFRPPWTIEQFYDALSSWAGLVSTQGTPLDEKVELDAWLVKTAKAGYLEAYCHQLLGPAFPAEVKAYKAGSAAELKAYKDYLKQAALKPAHAALPDDLVRVK